MMTSRSLTRTNKNLIKRLSLNMEFDPINRKIYYKIIFEVIYSFSFPSVNSWNGNYQEMRFSRKWRFQASGTKTSRDVIFYTSVKIAIKSRHEYRKYGYKSLVMISDRNGCRKWGFKEIREFVRSEYREWASWQPRPDPPGIEYKRSRIPGKSQNGLSIRFISS